MLTGYENRVHGKYFDINIPCAPFDYVSLVWQGGANRTCNLVEVNDDGDFVLADVDEFGRIIDYSDVLIREPIDCDFVCRWEDERFLIGAYI